MIVLTICSWASTLRVKKQYGEKLDSEYPATRHRSLYSSNKTKLKESHEQQLEANNG